MAYCAVRLRLADYASLIRPTGLRAVWKKVGASRSGADFFLRSNKPRLCAMKMFISRECDLIPVGGSLYSPRSVHREGRYFARRSKGGTGCGTRVRGSLRLTPGHIQRAAAGQTCRGETPVWS